MQARPDILEGSSMKGVLFSRIKSPSRKIQVCLPYAFGSCLRSSWRASLLQYVASSTLCDLMSKRLLSDYICNSMKSLWKNRFIFAIIRYKIAATFMFWYPSCSSPLKYILLVLLTLGCGSGKKNVCLSSWRQVAVEFHWVPLYGCLLSKWGIKDLIIE